MLPNDIYGMECLYVDWCSLLSIVSLLLPCEVLLALCHEPVCAVQTEIKWFWFWLQCNPKIKIVYWTELAEDVSYLCHPVSRMPWRDIEGCLDIDFMTSAQARLFWRWWVRGVHCWSIPVAPLNELANHTPLKPAVWYLAINLSADQTT